MFNPSVGYYPNQATQGENVGFTFVLAEPGSDPVGLSQTLNEVLTANTHYSLLVDVGNEAESDPNDGNDYTGFPGYGFPGYEVQLLAGGQVIAADHNSLCIAEGEFGTSTVTFTAGSDSSYLGQNLGIRLIDLNAGPGTEVDFDNVHLTANAAPTHSCCGC